MLTAVGTPSILSSLEYDCAPPRNIMDFEIYVEMEQLPESQPTALFSDVTFLYCASQSISLRVRLCAVANSLRNSATFQDTLQDEQSVQDALARLPKWKESHTLLQWTLLDLQLRQFLIIMHTQRALNGQLGANPEYRYSLLTALEASATLLERHVELMDTDSFVLCCIRSDYLRAALLICHIAYHTSLTSGELTAMLPILVLLMLTRPRRARHPRRENSIRRNNGKGVPSTRTAFFTTWSRQPSVLVSQRCLQPRCHTI